MHASTASGIGAVLLTLLGLLLGFWPMSFFGLLVALAFGGWPLALCLAAFFDVLWGAPVGMLHFVPLPFTMFALIVVLAREALMRHMRADVPEGL